MANKMLIDASHPEETRVVVLRGNRVEEFDFESASRKPLRGNIYLAKVTRVEPSLQAAFVEYGGNRHGFLAFSEIHPDYYQIPVADRQALLEEEAREDDEEEEDEGRRPRSRRRRRDHQAERRNASKDSQISEEVAEVDAAGLMIDIAIGENGARPAEAGDAPAAEAAPATNSAEPVASAQDAAPATESVEPAVTADEAAAEPAQVVTEAASVEPAPAPDMAASTEAEAEAPASVDASPNAGEHEPIAEAASPPAAEESDEDEEDEDEDEEEEHVEQVGGDALEEMPRRKSRARRHYKIQEVIKRRQVLLVQVVKEERGNKGAALTTYLSLAGRYSVLMPNTARGGGISRKITDTGDRKRLKSIVQDLDVPEGMGVILRTAGAARTRPEVKRDFEYLLRMWENVRELTLRSSAPTLVYEEGSLIKRAIRDLYSKEIDEVVVAGDGAWREARDFMRLIMPTHARNVVPWREPQPIFVRSGVEAQLDAMFSNHVTLRSGGYLVINQTEALVAIDVNSGRSTREHNIEDTALRTNLEAADEVARQLRLRDLAGLIVVDFIDMEENRNNRSVERRLKEALKNDRARIQVGRISHFGLLEMSRQRIRTGVLEGSTQPCPHCAGTGMVRSASSVALHVLRVIEDALTKDADYDLIARTRTDVALYILNHKRAHLRDIERRFGVHISIEADDELSGQSLHALERGEPATGTPEPFVPPAWEPEPEDDAVEEAESSDEAEGSEDTEESEEVSAGDGADDQEGEGDEGQRKRRRRRRRRGRADRNGAPNATEDAAQVSDEEPVVAAEADPADFVSSEASPSGREGFWAREATGAPVPFRTSRDETESDDAPAAEPAEHVPAAEPVVAEADHHAEPQASVIEAAPQETAAAPEPAAPEPAEQEAAAHEAPAQTPPAPPAPVQPPREPTEIVITEADPSAPKRGGWWSRAKATLGGG